MPYLLHVAYTYVPLITK